MKLTKSNFKQVLKEVLKEEDAPHGGSGYEDPVTWDDLKYIGNTKVDTFEAIDKVGMLTWETIAEALLGEPARIRYAFIKGLDRIGAGVGTKKPPQPEPDTMAYRHDANYKAQFDAYQNWIEFGGHWAAQIEQQIQEWEKPERVRRRTRSKPKPSTQSKEAAKAKVWRALENLAGSYAQTKGQKDFHHIRVLRMRALKKDSKDFASASTKMGLTPEKQGTTK
jgi:hypothetical protein